MAKSLILLMGPLSSMNKTFFMVL